MGNKKSKLIHLFIEPLNHWLKGTILPTRQFIDLRLTIIQIIIIFSIFLIFFSCRDKPTPPPDVPPYVPPIVLTAEDIGVTDAFIRLRFVDTTVNRAFKLTRDGQTILTAQCSLLDTLVLDEGLLPKQSYTYKAFRILNNVAVDSSAPLIITTMDTTSHNFTWQIDTLGDGASSCLYDVAIINDTLAYAVGEIYKKDSLGNCETDAYNLARWNGEVWTLIRVPIKIWNTSAFMYAPLKTIFAFDGNNICVTTGGQVIWYNGQNWGNWQFLFSSLDDPTFGGINKFWGTSKSDLYGVGNKGNIFHYNGTSWRRLESGTSLDLTDIYGSNEMLLASGVNISTVKGIVVKKYGTNWETIAEGDLITDDELFKPKLYGSITSVWINEKNTIYAGGEFTI